MRNSTVNDGNENLPDILSKFLNVNKEIVEIISILNNFHEQINCIERCPKVMFTYEKYPEWKDKVISKLEFLLTENFDDLMEKNIECYSLVKSFYNIIENQHSPMISISFMDDITEIGMVMNECCSYYNSMVNNIFIEYPLKTFTIIEESSTFRKLYSKLMHDIKFLK
uniref:DHC_N1 domain-containing protein n=1 Tax=Strongyloides venezuelensis TaxID=75913 RepID=A0A0K0FU61_STRVS